jgi:hypothetical protein
MLTIPQGPNGRSQDEIHRGSTCANLAYSPTSKVHFFTEKQPRHGAQLRYGRKPFLNGVIWYQTIDTSTARNLPRKACLDGEDSDSHPPYEGAKENSR